MSDPKLELGHFREIKSQFGEASTYEVSLREAGAMPVKVRARLNFGYGSSNIEDDKAFAQRTVDALNTYDELFEALDEIRQQSLSAIGQDSWLEVQDRLIGFADIAKKALDIARGGK